MKYRTVEKDVWRIYDKNNRYFGQVETEEDAEIFLKSHPGYKSIAYTKLVEVLDTPPSDYD